MNLHGVAVNARGLAQLLDGDVDLVGDEEIQPQDVVVRVARPAAVDPLAIAQLVTLPRLADGQTGEQREQSGDERKIVQARTYQRSCTCTTPSTR